MADLTAKFKLIDEMSSKLGAIGDSGERMVQQFDRAGASASQVFDRISSGSTRSVTSATSVATAVGTIDSASSRATASASSLSDAVGRYEDAASGAVEQTDYWTDAIGNYDKDAMEAIYTTQELVDMGFKTEAALEAEAQAMGSVGDSSGELADAVDEAAQAEGRLAEQFDETGDAGETAGKKGVEAIDALQSALQAAGIAKLLHEIYEAFKECSDAAAAVETMSAKVETIANTTVTSMSDINHSVTALSNDTGKSVTALLDSTYNAISAGVETANAVEFVDQANQLAVGGFTSATTAVDVLTTSLNAYQLSVDKAGQISDYLITTQNLGKTTVDELAQSVGKVIPVASAYNVQMDNLSTAYANMTANGIATLESGTYLRAMLTELGNTSSNVSKVLTQETGESFAQLSAEGKSLGDIMQILGDSVHGDATAFANLWQSSTAGVGALSLFNSGAEKFNSTLEQMRNSAGAATKAYETMTSTTEAAHDRMTAASDNLAVSVGSALNPAVTKLYDGIAKVKGGLAEFLSENPGVVKAVTALAVGFGTATVGITGFVTVTKVVIPLVKSLGTAFLGLEASLGPAGWIVIGLTAITAAGTALVAMMDDAVDMSTTLTASTQAQYDELNRLESAYADACDKFGETSDEASRLKYQIDDLSASIEQNGQTLEQSRNAVESFVEEYSRISEEGEKAIQSANDEGVANLALIAKLEALASKTDSTAASQEGMRSIIDQLNSSMDGLNLTYDDFIANQSGSIDVLKEFARQQARTAQQQAQFDDYVSQLNAADQATQKLEAAQAELEAATTAYEEARAALAAEQKSAADTTGTDAGQASYDNLYAAAAAVEVAQQNIEDLQGTLDSATEKINEYEVAWGWTSETTQESAGIITDWRGAATYAIDSVSAEMQTLVESYQAAYDAALTSFEGQFGLFDTAQADASKTVAAAQAALDSQLAYWNDYAANIDVLRSKSADDLGMTEENYNALMAYVQSGTEEAAGLAASMAEAINSGNAEAVSQLGQTLADVKSAQDQAASATADWVTDFSGKMDELKTKMNETVEALNLDDEASAAATATIQAYAQAIQTNQSAAVSAAQRLAQAVSAALKSASTTINIGVSGGKVPGHASGTTNAEDAFVAGERGPELILDHAGATVFPTEETDKIVRAISDVDSYDRFFPDYSKAQVQSVVSFSPALQQALQDYASPERRDDRIIMPTSASTGGDTGAAPDNSPQEKTIRLEINGTGEIAVGSGTSKEEVLEVLTQNLRPVLLGIIQSEVFEEGDYSYDY